MARFIADVKGAWTVWNLFFLAMFIALSGLAIDLTNAFRYRAMLQSIVDVSTTAAAQDLPDTDAAEATALRFAALNAEAAIFGENVITSDDIQFGNYDLSRGRDLAFERDGAPINAVRIDMGNTDSRGNGVTTFLLGYFGYPTLDVSVSATATYSATLDQCPNGFVARGAVQVQGSNTYDGTCIHGNRGRNADGDLIMNVAYSVSMQQDNNVVAATSTISMPDPNSHFQEGGSNTGVGRPYNQDGVSNPESAVYEGSRDPVLVDQLYCTRVRKHGEYQSSPGETDKVDALSAADCRYGAPYGGLYSILSKDTFTLAEGGDFVPPEFTGNNYLNAETSWSDTEYDEGKRYVIDGDVTIKPEHEKDSGWVENVMIMATGKIQIDSDVQIRNVLLFSRYSGVEFGSNIRIGDNFCDDLTGIVYLLGNYLKFGSNNDMNGVIGAAADEVLLASNMIASNTGRGISIEAGSYIDMQSDNEFAPCANPLPTLYGPSAVDVLAQPSGAQSILVQ